MTRKTTKITGADVKPGMVVKIGGRWYRIVRFDGDGWKGEGVTRSVMAVTVPHNWDPRMADQPGAFRPGRGQRAARHRVVWAQDEYLTREQPAPVWEWVTRGWGRS